MRIRTLSVASLLLSFLCVFPHQATASESDPAKLIASLNDKTAKIVSDWVSENKATGESARQLEVNSYLFTFEKGIMHVKLEEEIKTFRNKQHLSTNNDVSKISFPADQIDLQKIRNKRGLVDIVCRDGKNCMQRQSRITIYRKTGAKKNVKKDRDFPTFMFQIRSPTESLADQIRKDMEALFTLLAPPPKPVGKAETTAVGEK